MAIFNPRDSSLNMISGAVVALFAAALPLATVAQPCGSAQRSTEQARLAIDAEKGVRHVRSLFANKSARSDTLSYELVVEKEGAAGRSTSRQSGAFETQPGKIDTLSRSSVGVQPNDRLRVMLSVFDDERLVSAACADTTISLTP